MLPSLGRLAQPLLFSCQLAQTKPIEVGQITNSPAEAKQAPNVARGCLIRSIPPLGSVRNQILWTFMLADLELPRQSLAHPEWCHRLGFTVFCSPPGYYSLAGPARGPLPEVPSPAALPVRGGGNLEGCIQSYLSGALAWAGRSLMRGRPSAGDISPTSNARDLTSSVQAGRHLAWCRRSFPQKWYYKGQD